MAGLLAANMLVRRQPSVLEKASSLPNNHTAVLRFRSSVVSDVLGIPFKRVTMIKAVSPWLNPIADALAYSFKNTGVSRSDRSINASQLVQEDRYIAPTDLINQMADGLPNGSIAFDADFFHNKDITHRDGDAIISTIPMPALMAALDYPLANGINFGSMPGTNIKARIKDCDAYASLYITNPEVCFSRISITGNELIAEIPGEEKPVGLVGLDGSITPQSIAESALKLAQYAGVFLGIEPTRIYGAVSHRQQYAKILPIPDDVRKEFMAWATHEHNIYSLGRYATWRPSLLLDDLVQDIRLIEKWITKPSKYEINKRSK